MQLRVFIFSIYFNICRVCTIVFPWNRLIIVLWLGSVAIDVFLT